MKKNKSEEIMDETVQDEPDEVAEETLVDIDSSVTLQQENASLLTEIETLKNDYMKVHADTENLRKRMQKEYELSQKYRIQSFASSILPALDNLERALNQKDESASSYREGVQMIYNQIMDALKAEGVEPIEAINKPFDPNIHQAMMTEAKEGVKPNIVLEELQKGYMLKDRILRASLVKVSE